MKFLDDRGSSALEFVMLTALLLAPTILLAQNLADAHLRRVAIEAIASEVARDYSLHHDLQSARQLSQLLASKMSLEQNPETEIGVVGDKVHVLVNYKSIQAEAWQMLDDTGSGSPLIIAGFLFSIFGILAGAQAQSAAIAQMRTDHVARFLLHEHFADPTVDLQPEAQLMLPKYEVLQVDFKIIDEKTNGLLLCVASEGFSVCAKSFMRV